MYENLQSKKKKAVTEMTLFPLKSEQDMTIVLLEYLLYYFI